jgi:uncharacterized protein (DUF952 family)
MAEIYHMLPRATWESVRGAARYAPASLATDGFIHFTAGERNLIHVANMFYKREPGDWVILIVDPARIDATVRWEQQPDGMAYPHVYGDLNLSAVIGECTFPRLADGTFVGSDIAPRDAPPSP